MILLDTNVLFDVLNNEATPEADWSRAMLDRFASTDAFAVNVIVQAETASHFTSPAEQAEFLADLGVTTLPLDDIAAFRAGHAFRFYRKKGGQRTTILPDFLIGAHAATLGATLMTRDRRLNRYFPELTLLTPESDHG